MDAEWAFHAEMSAIFHSGARPAHQLPAPRPFAGKIAYLPFQVEACTEGGATRYLVSRVARASRPNVRGRGRDNPLERHTDRPGGPGQRQPLRRQQPPARIARGIESLTIRSLRLHLPPDEEWVTVTYVGLDGVRRELREPWLVAENLPPMADLDAP
jgi:hypothetical protein